jgi:hypothetical protein
MPPEEKEEGEEGDQPPDEVSEYLANYGTTTK